MVHFLVILSAVALLPMLVPRDELRLVRKSFGNRNQDAQNTYTMLNTVAAFEGLLLHNFVDDNLRVGCTNTMAYLLSL